MRGKRAALSACLVAGCATVGWAQTRSENPGLAVVPNCVLSFVEEVETPAQEAGPLASVRVVPGQNVAAGEPLAQLDDRAARIDQQIAQREFEIARDEAASDIDVQFAQKSEQVAYFAFQRALEANKSHVNVVVETELKRLQFEWERAKLQIVQAQLALQNARQSAEIAHSKLEAAQNTVERRQIRAPIAGQVVLVHKDAGEWVAPGDALVQIVRLDRLRIKGFLNAREFAPGDVIDRPARVRVALTGGRQEEFPGRVSFVSPKEEADGKFAVWIDVQNRQVNGHWLLSAGKRADVELDLRAPATPAALPPAAARPLPWRR
ncbi:MAG: HlyD family efflux transporter periplasmic adaptor subunit [Pirellulales bacterium]